MKRCPGPLVWQAVVDGEAEGAHYRAHLERCPACRATYRKIGEAAALADQLGSAAELRPGFEEALLAGLDKMPARSFPAGLVAALLFAVSAAGALLVDPGFLNLWLSVGLTRSCSIFMDALFRVIYLGQNLPPAWLLGPALLFVLMEMAVLKKLKMAEGS